MPTSNEADINILRDHDPVEVWDHIPDPAELLAWGGVPGIQYAMVASQNITEAKNLGWIQCRDVAIQTIKGPKGTCEMIVMARGEPIQAAAPDNGIRHWFFDPTLLSVTGHAEPEAPKEPTPSGAAAAKAAAKAATSPVGA